MKVLTKKEILDQLKFIYYNYNSHECPIVEDIRKDIKEILGGCNIVVEREVIE